MERYGDDSPTQLVAHSSALYGGANAPVLKLKDRMNERKHFTKVREEQRNTVERLARVQGAALVNRAQLEALEQAHRERKMAVAQAERESRLIAQDDPVLAAKMAVMDDDFTQALRLRGLR
jgi:hypothetical protein